MDTASHLLLGATLAGLSLVDPVVAANKEAMFAAVLAGTMIGSHAPDFDTFARLKGPAVYLRVHRGITHSLPALFLWPLLISLPLAAGFGLMHVWPHLYGWTFAAVVLHVFLDLCNAYGVQCFRPFTRRWQHWDILSLHEPLLFVLHAAALAVWLWNGTTASLAASLFPAVYAATFGYIAFQAFHRRWLVRKVKRELRLDGDCQVIPTLHLLHWQFVLDTGDSFHTGFIQNGVVNRQEIISKSEPNPIIEATMQTDGVRTFLHFAKQIHWMCTEGKDGYVVQGRDVRFWHNGRLPFGVDVKLDRNLNVVRDEIGWRKKVWEGPYV